MVSLLARGNAYILVQWLRDGSIGRLVVLAPDKVTIEHTGGLKSFRVMGTDGGSSVFPPLSGTFSNEILHLKGMSLPGSHYGLNPIEVCSETFGISLAAQRYGANFFANDGTPGGIIEIPPEVKLSPTGQKALREAWRDLHGGPANAKTIAVLVDGAKYSSIQVSPDEAQFLETRKFQVSDIARIYGVPPHLLADASNSTSWGSGLAEQNTAYVIHSLRPWLERVEARLTMLVRIEAMRMAPGVSTLDGPQAFINLNEEALLRGATSERWTTHRANVMAGVLTADEVRLEEGLPPLPNELGAVPWIPLAQAPSGIDPQESESNPSPEAMEGDTSV
jgi:HK97 family phage portal protein